MGAVFPVFFSKTISLAKKLEGWKPALDLFLFPGFPNLKEVETDQLIIFALQVGQWTTSLVPNLPPFFSFGLLVLFLPLGRMYQFVAMPLNLGDLKNVRKMALKLGISVHILLYNWLIRANSCHEAHFATLS